MRDARGLQVIHGYERRDRNAANIIGKHGFCAIGREKLQIRRAASR
jgi:hypothetical protein